MDRIIIAMPSCRGSRSSVRRCSSSSSSSVSSPEVISLFLTFLLLLAGFIAVPAAAQTPQYDLILRNGRIVDGTGKPWYRADAEAADDVPKLSVDALEPGWWPAVCFYGLLHGGVIRFVRA